MKKYSLKQKLEYWLENRLSKSTLSLIKIIAIVTVVVALTITLILTACGLSSVGDFFYTFWDTLTSSINAWMPYSEDGDYNTAYLLLTSIASIVGLFVTSLLISIISSALEEKIEDIKKGNSLVLENDHIVVFGFVPGEYTLIKQLISNADGNNITILVASDYDKQEMESLINDNIDVPDNARIVCRNIDICSTSDLKICSLENCRSIIISPMEDEKAVKCVFALNKILKNVERDDMCIVATLRDKNYILPDSFSSNKNVLVLMLNDFIARIISKTCCQPGLSLAYLELFNDKGSELYNASIDNIDGLCFGDLLNRVDMGTPVGIMRDGETILNPDNDFKINNGDGIIAFAYDKNSVKLLENDRTYDNLEKEISKTTNIKKLLILGYNEVFETIVEQLPKGNYEIVVAGAQNDNYDKAVACTKGMGNITIDDKHSIDDIDDLEYLVNNCDRVALLNNHDKNGDAADIKVMLRIAKLRDIRERLKLNYSISIEMRRAANRTLISEDDFTDYIVRSNMFSMFLAQLSNNPELKDTYKQILSNSDNQVQLIPASDFNCVGEHRIDEIRNVVKSYNYIFMGYLSKSEKDYEQHFNPGLFDVVNIKDEDNFVVLGK